MMGDNPWADTRYPEHAAVLGRVVRLGGTAPAVVDALDRLERLLARYESALSEPRAARRDLDDIREGAGQGGRDDGRLDDALRRLAGHVAAVGVLAEAVRQLAGELNT